MVIRNTNAVLVITSSHPTARGRERGKQGDRVSGHIRPARIAARRALFTMTTNTTQITVVVTSDVIIRS